MSEKRNDGQKAYGLDTLAVHAGFRADPAEGSIEVPIHQTAAYMFESTDYAKALFELKATGNVYSRLSNPTSGVLEERVAALEGGVGAVAFASGHAAMFSSIINLAGAGDEMVSSLNIYGGAINMFAVTLGSLGIKVRFVAEATEAAWEAAINEKTKALFVETVGNPNANVADLTMISGLAKKYGIPLIVDSTFTTPALVRPKEWGADIVIHSATKFLGGHGTSIAGIAVDCGTFQFLGNPRFPRYNEPDHSYHGVVFGKEFGDAAFSARLRSLVLRDVGGCLSPFSAYLILHGMETLGLRMDRHCENALKAAEFLQSHPKVASVSYPALPASPYKALVDKQMGGRGGAVFTFELAGGRAAGGAFIDALQLAGNVANVGDTKTQVIHPATTTHSQLTEEQLRASGITGATVRISVGIENIEDILGDLGQALDRA